MRSRGGLVGACIAWCNLLWIIRLIQPLVQCFVIQSTNAYYITILQVLSLFYQTVILFTLNILHYPLFPKIILEEFPVNP